jgi:DNA-cytosine methyltransferase
MKLLDLFSGIGGFSLGAEYNNIKTIGFVEKDAFCQKVLRKHWPNTPIIGDIRDVKRDTFESVNIVSGGFPCQPFSVAGKRRGTDDDRYLWDETIRVVSLYKPRWFVGENVEGIVNIQNGMVLRQVQDDLEKEGFEVQCGIIPASGIGAWHQRKRVWIIAYSNSNRESRRSQYVQEGSRELGESYVSNTHDSRNRTSRYGSQREGEKNAKEGQNRSQFESSRHSENDVPNSNSSLRRGRGAILQSRENKIWGFYNEKSEQTSYDLRSETIRCDVVSGEKEDVSNPQSRTGEQTQWQGRESIGRGSDDRSRLEREGKNIETDVSNSSSERQLHRESGNLGEESRETQGARENDTQGIEDTSARGGQKYVSNSYNSRFKQSNEKMARGSSEQFDSCSIQPRQDQKNIQYSHNQRSQEHELSQKSEEQTLNSGKLNAGEKPTQSWWEIESSVCSVPNGVSYRLDKDRVNQIKSLGNSIVPQIAYQIFKAIVTVDKEE